ncbi:MAG: hypothetical protein JNJ94_16280 [Chlorobi bacterium]|nr:hypothetical protein [Chlorobiota bacterium]
MNQRLRVLVVAIAIVASIVASIAASTATLHAQPRIESFGFGLMLGEPTGVTLKGGLSGNNAWDAMIGTSWLGNLTLGAGYLWNANVFNSNKAGLYFGLGGVVGIGRGNSIYIKDRKEDEDEEATGIGARGVVGFNTIPFRSPVEFFAELDPIVVLAPSPGVSFMAAIGVRYYP